MNWFNEFCYVVFEILVFDKSIILKYWNRVFFKQFSKIMIEIYLSFLSGYLNFWNYYVVIVKNFLYIIKCKISFVKFFKFGYK